ncbi:malonate decarboxylase holo-ACP synthase [Erwiniaceae bacterium CAU 1747]
MSSPHDLIWVSGQAALQGDLPEWVASQWRPALPLVVRRDFDKGGRVPVGVRGLRRDLRAAGWVDPRDIRRILSPETLSDSARLLASPYISQPPLQAAFQLAQQTWPWRWGITGSVGYALATELPVLRAGSDLDLLIRSEQPLDDAELLRWQTFVSQLTCRVDTQIGTPQGGFSLTEWLREGRVLLKTQRGPRLTDRPWSAE